MTACTPRHDDSPRGGERGRGDGPAARAPPLTASAGVGAPDAAPDGGLVPFAAPSVARPQAPSAPPLCGRRDGEWPSRSWQLLAAGGACQGALVAVLRPGSVAGVAAVGQRCKWGSA
eukprot:355543-Chlamydomonas_euryale.AAC.7